jgi:DNA-binding response OmpR family regulator
MDCLRVLIVEDELPISLELEFALGAAGHAVCGIATSQTEAIQLATRVRPDCAVVDISLRPGDGRVVARALTAQGVAVLLATGQCDDVSSLARTGALGCLPKSYRPDDVPAALTAICRSRRGETPFELPDNMVLLSAS